AVVAAGEARRAGVRGAAIALRELVAHDRLAGRRPVIEAVQRVADQAVAPDEPRPDLRAQGQLHLRVRVDRVDVPDLARRPPIVPGLAIPGRESDARQPLEQVADLR